MRRLGLQSVIVRVFSWLPFLALAGLGVWVLGVRVLFVVASLAVVFWNLRRTALTRPRHPLLQVVGMSLLLGTAGGFGFGGLGFIFGLAAGAAVGIGSAYDLKLKNREGAVAPLDPLDSVQQATLGKLAAFVFTVPLFVALIGLIWVAATR
jgi:hypothetical protein